MVGRTLESSKYRYGFNGKEKDGETVGEGNQYDYGFRIYNPRVGRFLSVDPLTKQYSELTPYQFASNSPLSLVDVDGAEGAYKQSDGTIRLNPYAIGDGLKNPPPPPGSTIVDIANPDEVKSGTRTIIRVFRIIPWTGLGISLFEAGVGEDISTGKKLSFEERVMYLNQVTRIVAKSSPGAQQNSETKPSATNSQAENSSVRPSPSQSEKDLVPNNAAEQVPFKNGKVVPKNTKSSVRPDGYDANNKISYEIKNYAVDTEKGITSLVNNVVKQVRQRISNLPKGTQQTVIIDTRGQKVNQITLNKIKSRISTEAGSQNVNVQFKTD